MFRYKSSRHSSWLSVVIVITNFWYWVFRLKLSTKLSSHFIYIRGSTGFSTFLWNMYLSVWKLRHEWSYSPLSTKTPNINRININWISIIAEYTHPTGTLIHLITLWHRKLLPITKLSNGRNYTLITGNQYKIVNERDHQRFHKDLLQTNFEPVWLPFVSEYYCLTREKCIST